MDLKDNILNKFVQGHIFNFVFKKSFSVIFCSTTFINNNLNKLKKSCENKTLNDLTVTIKS